VDLQQIAEAQGVRRWRELANNDQMKAHVAKFLKNILGGASGSELEPKPWEAIARPRGGVGEWVQSF